MELMTLIKAFYPQVTDDDFDSRRIYLQDDGKGVYIREWKLDLIQPTDEDLEGVKEKAELMEENQRVIEKRRQEYGTLEEQMAFLIENGFEVARKRVKKIKEKFPKRRLYG